MGVVYPPFILGMNDVVETRCCVTLTLLICVKKQAQLISFFIKALPSDTVLSQLRNMANAVFVCIFVSPPFYKAKHLESL